ncbi:hypothetical protein HDU82_007369 [Entophlyctis luteolus]|nr:hypothetical protein HDU82_007369 [Entophlyctis luteolus]
MSETLFEQLNANLTCSANRLLPANQLVCVSSSLGGSSNTTITCNVGYVLQNGDTCSAVGGLFRLSNDAFDQLNPDVPCDDSGSLVDHVVCLEGSTKSGSTIIGGPVSISANSSVPKIDPISPCQSLMRISANDSAGSLTCLDLVSQFKNFSLTELSEWNYNLDCWNLLVYDGQYVCVNGVGYAQTAGEPVFIIPTSTTTDDNVPVFVNPSTTTKQVTRYSTAFAGSTSSSVVVTSTSAVITSSSLPPLVETSANQVAETATTVEVTTSAITTATNVEYTTTAAVTVASTTAAATTAAATVAAKSQWSGVNSYFIHTLPSTDQESLLTSLQSAGVTKIRIFITSFAAGGKSTNSVGADDLETTTVGVYDDTILDQIDQLMLRMSNYGMQLLICMHDRWSLTNEWGYCDGYCQKYSYTQFYTSSAAAADFDNRLAHVVQHRNPYMNNQMYKDLSSVIYAVEIQNEAQGTGNTGGGIVDKNWWCNRATALKNVMGSSAVKVSTGGGQNFEDSLLAENFACSAIDVVAMHSYSTDLSSVSTYLDSANASKNASQIVLFEEFGLNTAAKASWIDSVAAACNARSIPWMPWEASTHAFSDDYEFSPDDTATWAVLAQNAP